MGSLKFLKYSGPGIYLLNQLTGFYGGMPTKVLFLTRDGADPSPGFD